MRNGREPETAKGMNTMHENHVRIGALYIRVSTEDQTEYSPNAQKRLLLDYARKNSITVPNEYVFIEEGVSGRKADKRPQFQKMIGLAKSKDHPFDVILVWNFSRFARNQEESIVYKSLLRRNNVDVISISESVADGPFGSLIERIIEWMDEYYSIRLSEEVKRGMTEKALRGEYQTCSPFGYRVINGELHIEEETAPIVRRVFEMYLYENKNYRAIARKLNEMGIKTTRGNPFESRTIKYMLQNPVYKGYVRWNPSGKGDLRRQKDIIKGGIIIRKGSHKPIVPEDIWDAVNEKILSAYRQKYAKPNDMLSHWLSGVLYCSNCNHVLVSGGASGGFQCHRYAKGVCAVSHYVSFTKIEKIVIDAVRELAATGDFDYEIIEADPYRYDIEAIQNNIKRLEQKEARIKDSYINGFDTLEEYKSNKEKLQAERNALEEQLKAMRPSKETYNGQKDIMNHIKGLYSIVASNTDIITKNTAIRSVVKKIVYNKRAESIDVFLFYS